MVPKREGKLRTLSIRNGWDVLDNNLLACPERHLSAVFDMLRRQPQKPRFTGGLEAARMNKEVAEELLALKPAVMFFAYDRPQQKHHLERAFSLIRGIKNWSKGTMRHYVSCYILVGHDGDTVPEAEKRIAWVIDQGVRAYPMYFRDECYAGRPPEWHDLIGGIMSFGGKG